MTKVSIGLGLAGVCYLAVCYFFDPAAHPFPKCPSYLLTGLKCPGCGSQRALHQLMHGHIWQALQLNALFVLGLPYVAFGLLLEHSEWGRRQEALRRRWYGRHAARIAFVAIIAFAVGRNLLGA